MSFLDQFQTLPKEEVKQALFDILNGKAMDVLSSMQEEQITEADDKEHKPGSYSDKNPKIDLHNRHNGEYIASTNWSPNTKHAVKAYELKNPDMTGHVRAYINKGKNESVDESTEFFQIDEGVRKVADYCCGRHKATTHKDSETGEYQVKFHTDGKHAKDADYFTDDKEDAAGTAKKQVDAMHAKDSKSVDESIGKTFYMMTDKDGKMPWLSSTLPKNTDKHAYTKYENNEPTEIKKHTGQDRVYNYKTQNMMSLDKPIKSHDGKDLSAYTGKYKD